MKSIGLFVTSILIAFAAVSVATTAARQEVQRFLRELPSDAIVYVDGQRISDQEEVVSILKGITSYWAHHSHPTTRIRVDVMSSKGNLGLELGRDSGKPREYWVFSPGQSITSKNEIGRITTSAFDKY